MLFSFENIHRQYLLCRKNKRNTINALRFEVRQEKELLKLYRQLSDRTYRPGRSVCFFSEKPKLREIFAADFRDRIVHHILVDYLESIWEPIFIHDSYACRKGKGIHKGVARLRQFIRQAIGNGSRRAWYLQLDIKNYFMTMDKEILFSQIRRRCPDPEALWLSRVLIFHDCTENPVLRGNGKLARRIPAHKTLFHAPKGKGLPIGNLRAKLAGYEKKLVSCEGGWRIYGFDREVLDNLFATFTSYLGHFRHADSFKLVRAVWQNHSFLCRYFELDCNNRKIQRKYLVSGNLRAVRQQYGYIQKMFAGDIVFFQVGRFFELYHRESKAIAGLLNLSPLKKNRRGARYGFPVRYFSRYLGMAFDKGKSVVVVLEGDYVAKIKERKVWRRYECTVDNDIAL